VHVRLFAQAREVVGQRELDRPVPPGGASLDGFLTELVQEFPKLDRILKHCRFAINGAYTADRTAPLAPGDDLGIHPPYSGG
jgi:molybdopterin converting factor small subunit